jgi:hypothetical protein
LISLLLNRDNLEKKMIIIKNSQLIRNRKCKITHTQVLQRVLYCWQTWSTEPVWRRTFWRTIQHHRSLPQA